MDLKKLLAWLEGHINIEATAGKVEGLSLARMERLLELLGNPHLDVPAVHLTGTNGKGSTAQMITRILVAHGLSVGTYASPHIEKINERIQRDGEQISDDDLAATLVDVRLAADHMTAADDPPSWFEIVTATAFRYFSDAAVDAAVIEVGMLGRYDATNVAATRVAVVTNVRKDHTDGAPGWREAIASEKAGIVKPTASLVLGETDPALQEIFLAEGPSTALRRDVDFETDTNVTAIGGRMVDVRTPRTSYDDVFVSLHGEHQGRNAALAIVAAEEFLDGELVREHLDAALGGAVMLGRFEIIAREPLVVLDGAHNVAGAAVAARTLAEDFHVFGGRFILVGMMRGKSPEELLEALDVRSADLVVCCEPNWPRALPAAELGAIAVSLGAQTEVISSPLDGLERLVALSTENDSILVTGSMYVVGAVRRAASASVHSPE